MKLQTIAWNGVHASLHEKGYALLDGVLDKEDCANIVCLYGESKYFRKTILMERYRFGLGEYKYLQYPLPAIIHELREHLYEHLYSLANEWNTVLGSAIRYPREHQEFLNVCKTKNQTFATPLILKYSKGGYNTLHQDLYGDIYFPLQAVVFLNETGKDYTGGEFVLTEQIPRAQSKAIVLQPGQGDVLLFTTQTRPQKGVKGYYRVHMKHGVSTVHTGNRHSLGIIFHDAQ